MLPEEEIGDFLERGRRSPECKIGGEAFQLRPPLPHCHQSPLLRSRAKQRRRGIGVLEVAPDGQHLADRSAVFQHESRHNAARIDREIGIAVLFARREIDGDKRHGNSLFGKEHPHAPRIG